jgi:large repetitive protein
MVFNDELLKLQFQNNPAMRKHLFSALLLVLFLTVSKQSYSCHGVALVNFSFSVSATGVTVNGSSNSATCGCGPYWMQVEVACTAGGVTGVPPAAIQNTLASWNTNSGTTYNSHPWYNSLLNIPNYTSPTYSDQCVVEPYNSIFVPFTGLCPGQTYFFAAREWLGGSNSAGPWSAINSFTVPGILVPLTATVTASPTTICAGQCATLTVSGIAGGCGTASATWSSGLGAGLTKTVCPGATTTYTATVSTTSGCQTAAYPVTVTVIASINASFTASANQCLTGNTFTVTHTGTAGTTHVWNWGDGTANGSGTPATHSYTAAGTYTITHTASLGTCSGTSTQVVTVYPMPNIPTLVPVNPTCGLSNGSITCSATGGNTPYTWSINGGGFQASNVFSGLGAGTYTITVQTANGCTRTQTVTLTNQPGPTAVVLTPANTGCGVSTGQITIGAVTGGTPTYSFSLNNSAGPFTSTTTLTGLAAGTYTIYLQDANGCPYNQTTTVGTATGPTAFTYTTAPTACTSNTGSITVTGVTGGTAGYTYSFNNGSTFGASATATGLAAGTYTVIVKDANNCTFAQTVTVVTVPGPTNITYANSPAACGSATGAINATGVGGTAPYQFSLGGGAFQSSGTFSNLGQGTYSIQVRDANGCVFTNTTTIIANSAPTASVSATTNVSCFGGSNGTATITGTGGTVPYTFTLNTGTNNVTGNFTGLPMGSYSVTLSDANSCTSQVTFSITQPTQVTNAITGTTPVLCNGGSTGSITASAGGGTPGYTYSLNGGPAQVSGTFSGRPAGAYTITVTDLNGCAATASGNITQPTLLVLAMSSTNANCTFANGVATVTPSGGTINYTYSWSGGGGSGSSTTGVVSGNYNVTVTDANGCVATGSVSVGTTPGGTASITGLTNVTCNGASNGSMTASMTSTSATSYTYSWSPGGQITQTATGLGPNTYVVTVTDNFGCVSTATATITQPPVLTLGLGITNVSCNGGFDGTITATPAGGTPTYTYSWTPNVGSGSSISNLPTGNYSCVVTDLAGCTATQTTTINQPTALAITFTVTNTTCNQSNGGFSVTGSGGFPPYQFSIGGPFGSGTTFSNLAAGTYNVSIRDANLCTATFPVSILNTAGPTATISSFTNVTCNGACNGTATVNVTGGSGTITYAWSNGQATPIATNLCAGIYNVNATDQNGCVATIGVTITEPTPLQTSASGTNPLCFGGSTGTATASVLGGTPNYSFAWNSSPAQNTQTATGLPAGTYNVIITDANNCTSTASVVLVNPAALLVTVTGTDPTCFGTCDGTATATVSNGTSPISYLWNDPNAQTTPTAGGLCAGTFAVGITDANGCVASGNITLVQPTAIVVTITSSGPASCSGICDGYATGTASGGNGTYSFSWSSGGTGASATGLCVGVETLTVLDHLGCSGSANVSITEPNPLSLTATGTNVNCFGACDGTGTAIYSGGTAPYTFLWQPSLSQIPNPVTLCAGVHTLTILDSNGCSLQTTLTITEPNQLTATATASNSNCLQSNGTANVNFSGGTPPVAILWSNGITTNTNAGVPGGVYNCQLTDSNGCVVNVVANVNDISGPTVAITASTDITCFGYDDGTATATVNGGTTPYQTVHWIPSGTTGTSATGLEPGPNTFQVIDSAGCTASATVTLAEPSSFVTAITAINHVSCFGLCDGSATTLGNGGTPFANGSYNFSWSHGPTNPTLVNTLCAGTYSCTATDSLGCTSMGVVTITQPLQLIINNTPGASNVSCFGANNGSIIVNVNGGTLPYNYNWNPNIGSGPFITGLGPGVDTLSVVDNKGCIAMAIYTISEPPQLLLDSLVTTAVCGLANGSATVTATGGTQYATSPFYSFLWNTNPNQTTPAANSLSANTYSCTVTDANGCVSTIPVVVGNIAGPTLASITPTPVTCNGLSDGTAVIALNGGTNPLNYTWTNGSGANQNQNNATLANVPAGTYNVNVTDGNGCIVASLTTITQPNPLSLSANPQDTICFGQTGTVYCAAGGGTAPYTFNWTDGTNTFTGAGPTVVTPTTTTTYSVTVTDNNGCTIPGVQTAMLVRPPLNSATTNVAGCNQANVTISATAGGGNGGPYTYTWTGVGTGQTQSVVANSSNTPANYIVTISDGCSTPITDTVIVTAYPLPFGQVIPNSTSGCEPWPVTFTGATDIGTQFIWNYGDSTSLDTGSVNTHSFLNDGVYDITLTVISAQGCTTVVSNPQMITVYPLPVAEFTWSPSDPSVLNPIVNFVNASTGAVSYNWEFGDTTTTFDVSTLTDPSYSYGAQGDYTITLIAESQYGCLDTVYHPLYINPDFVIFVPNAFTPDEDGINDTFFPKGVGIDESKYLLMIYDRWGDKIFESNNWSAGWDGKANGGTDVVQMDVYVWRIITNDFKGNKHSLTGHVTVVK